MPKHSIYFKNATDAEPIIREFLFANSDTVRLTHWPKAKTFWIFVRPPKPKAEMEKDDKDTFQNFLDSVKEDFIKKEVENSKTEYYFFKLSSKIKELLTQYEYGLASGGGGLVPFMEDPTFYKDGEIIAHIISHEPIIDLYISNEKMEDFESQGVKFEDKV